MLVPVVGVDLVADDDVAEALDAVDGGGLVVGVGLLVDGVGRAEVEGVDADLGAEEGLGEGELEVDLGVGDFGDVGVGEGVVADLVAFAVDALHDADVVLGGLADHEEGGLDVQALEDVEDARGPGGIGAVVEGEGDLPGMVAVLGDGVGERVGVHGLFCDHLLRDGDLVVVVEGEGAVAVLGLAGDAEDVAVALGVDGVAGLDGGEVADGVGCGWGHPRSSRGSCPPGRGARGRRSWMPRSAGGTHLVEDGDGVEKPDLVADVGVVVVVSEVGVDGVGVDLDLGSGIGGGLPGILGGKLLGAEDLELGLGWGLAGPDAGLGGGRGWGLAVDQS